MVFGKKRFAKYVSPRLAAKFVRHLLFDGPNEITILSELFEKAETDADVLEKYRNGWRNLDLRFAMLKLSDSRCVKLANSLWPDKVKRMRWNVKINHTFFLLLPPQTVNRRFNSKVFKKTMWTLFVGGGGETNEKTEKSGYSMLG